VRGEGRGFVARVVRAAEGRVGDERDADYADCTDYADFEICWIVPCKILTSLAPKISDGRFWWDGKNQGTRTKR
jgi:hypothetical protein